MPDTSFLFSSCKECPEYKNCKEICPELEKILPKPRSGGHRKEFATDKIEEVYAHKNAKERGKQKSPCIYNDNWEKGS